MQAQQIANTSDRNHILMVAHCFDADFSMESRLSWIRATNAAKKCPTTVICVEPFADLRCNLHPQVPGLKVVAVAHTEFEKLLITTPFGFYLAYRLWHMRVLKVASKLHQQNPFSLVHQVSYCGYREPGYCWKLGVPFVWGPIGGTQNVPWKFLRTLDFFGAIKECWRSVANQIQLKLGRRVGQALRAAEAVYVANLEARESFRHARGIEVPCQLETGIEHNIAPRRELRETDRPLRVLWAGRLECWKALPLLLKAVAQLPSDRSIELRVLGSGTREARYKKLAERLGIADQIEWVPLPDYNLRDEHYRWADTFAFTSLRDTSGTGLLESLAAGVAILGLDHQGARDIMSESCAIRVPVQNPKQVIAALRDGLQQLAEDPELLLRLSNGALQRARNYHWDELNSEMSARYKKILGSTSRISVEDAPNSVAELLPVGSLSAN